MAIVSKLFQSVSSLKTKQVLRVPFRVVSWRAEKERGELKE